MIGTLGRPARRYAGVRMRARADTACIIDGSSAGTTTVKFGSEQASDTSSIPICDGPSSPMLMPACVPTTFTSRHGHATDMHSCSYVLHITKQAKLAHQERLPALASQW